MSEKIIFCGDLVCPFDCNVDYEKVKPLFKNAIGIANLEGAILKDKEQVNHFKWKDKYSLYSSPDALDILDNLNIKYVSLCNNHILDYEQPIEVTNQMLIQHGVNQWGLKNHDVLQLKLNGKNVYIITFTTFANEHSLNLFNPHKVIKDIESLRQNEPDCLIVVYPHWGVEKFYYPEPADRVLAHACVDAGANLIVGHHPHIIQPIEFYKGTTIIYSIGNFILPQTYYGEKKLVYKQKEVQQELAVEWDGSDVKFHPLYFDKARNTLIPDSSFNTNKLKTLFKDEIGYGHYLRIYLNHASKLDIFLRTRYMANLANEYISYISRNMLRYVRRAFILLKLHDPYKNDSQINVKGGGKNRLLNIRRSDSESLASKVLSIGINWRKPRGGVAAVENVYSTFYKPFNHISTVIDSNKLVKSLTAIKAFVCFVCWMLFRRKIKIVHVHGASYASFWRKRIFISLVKAFNKKVVYHCHGAEYKRFSAKHHNAVNRLLKKCDCVIALSESWKEWFKNEFDTKNVVVIKNVIAKPNISRQNKKDGEPFTLLFLGRLGKRKGIFDLLDVLADNKSQYNGKVLLLVGGDGEVETVKNIIDETGIDNIVHYEGWVSGEKKEQLLNVADAYILPSYNEGLPISILEAMSYGLPIISTNVGGIPEILKNGDNGFIIEPGDKKGMKNAIDSLMNDKSLRERMGEHSVQIVQPHLPEFVAERLTELYNSILENEKIY